MIFCIPQINVFIRVCADYCSSRVLRLELIRKVPSPVSSDAFCPLDRSVNHLADVQAAFDQLLQVEIPRLARQMISPEKSRASILPTQCPVKASELNAFISVLHSHGINVRYES